MNNHREKESRACVNFQGYIQNPKKKKTVRQSLLIQYEIDNQAIRRLCVVLLCTCHVRVVVCAIGL
jgi:hypothetical protein